MKKKAIITGVTGQDGAYLSEFLLKKKYEVHGIKRRASTVNNYRIDELYEKYYQKSKKKSFYLHYGDVTDSLNLLNLIKKIRPNEIYNLAAQSHVKVSFETPEYTSNADGLGVLRILEIIKNLNFNVKFYQASTSEMFGNSKAPQDENTYFAPQSPYGAAKLYGHWITKIYRNAYNMFACSGILFNHESPIRGETFVTKKIINSVAKNFLNKSNILEIGNLYAKRDWGHAKDYVEGMWKMLQQKKPDDFVISTGREYSVKEFINLSYKQIGINLIWKGKGTDEYAINKSTKKKLVKINKKYFRPNEVNRLRGNNLKARKILKWKPRTTIIQLIKEMLAYEIKKIKKK